MRTVRAVAVVAALWLVDAGSAQTPADAGAIDTALAAFPDDGLPGLLARLDRGDAAAAAQLAALGPAAHEALLGMLVRTDRPRPANLLEAFGGFDAHAAWSLPLLTADWNPLDRTAQELLCRLGPAAAPALPELRARATGRFASLAEFVPKLQKATDAPMPAGAAPVRPRVARELVPELLERLQHGPEAQRWPALQALLCAGDEAATAAAEVLVELALDAATAAAAAELALVLHCSYGTRCLPGMNPLAGVSIGDVPTEARRCVLARRQQQMHVPVWIASPDAGLRRTAVLAMLLQTERLGLAAWPTTDADPDVQRTIDRLHRVRRHRGAVAARELLAAVARKAPPEEVQKALDVLAGLDVRDAPDELWPVLCRIASGPDAYEPPLTRAEDVPGIVRHRRLTWLGRTAAGVLHAGVTAAPSSPALQAALSLLEPRAENQQLLRDLLAAADPGQVAALIRTASDDTAALARWITLLRFVEDRRRTDAILALVGDGLAREVPRLPAPAQLDWLELGFDQELPESDLVQLLRASDVAVRRRAIQVAWRRYHKWPIDLAPVLPLLDDPDETVARTATFLLAACRNDPQRAATAVAALIRRFPTAAPELQQYVMQALLQLREHAAPARATIDAAFASDAWNVRLAAALVLLAIDPEHAEARQCVVASVGDSRPEVRERALYQGANVPTAVLLLVDLAIERLDDPEPQVQFAAARLLGAARAAKDRALPALRAFIEKAPHASAASRAKSAIEQLERPPAEPIPAKR